MLYFLVPKSITIEMKQRCLCVRREEGSGEGGEEEVFICTTEVKKK